MVSIKYNENKKLQLKISGENFRDLVDFCKDFGCIFDKINNVWLVNISSYKSLINQISKIDEYEIDKYSENKIAEYFNSLKELKIKRRCFNYSLLKYPPLKGKVPNENYQLEDLMRAINQNRFLFNWEMGLGKSYTLAALIEHKRYYHDINKCLIFSTPIGVKNLKDELIKFGNNMRDNDIITFSSASAIKWEDRDVFNIQKYPQTIIIMTYDFLKSVSNYYYDRIYGTTKKPHPSSGKNYRNCPLPIKEWLGSEPGGLFLDENHSLAVTTSRRTNIMNWIVPYFEQRFEFTGTLADKYQKLYEPCWILDPALVDGMNYNEWLSNYNELGNRFSKYAVNDDKWDLEKLENLNKKLLCNYGSKRLMAECLDLPMNYEVPTFMLEMSPVQREIYESFSNFTAQDMAKMAKEQGKSFTDKMINMFQYLMSAVDNPECLKNSKHFNDFPEKLQKAIIKYDYNKDSAKVEALDDIINERVDENDQKGIIWYFHPQTKDALEKRYKKYNPCIISADVPMEDRVPKVKAFLADPKRKLLIASINVMNTSLTCVECKWEAYLETTFNYTIYAQSRGRIYRPGQKNVTRTYSMRYKNSLDNLQAENLKTKGEIIHSLMNQDYITSNIWKKLFSYKKEYDFNHIINDN